MKKLSQGSVTANQVQNSKSQLMEWVTHNSVNVEMHFSPIRFLLLTIGGIFLAEVVAMIIVHDFQDLPYSTQTLIDASIMIIMIFPLIYFLSLKPLIVRIDKQQRMEEALRQSEERFAKAFHSSPAALSITRFEDGSFIDVNQRFLQLSGYEHEEVIGQKLVDLGIYINPEERANLGVHILKQQMLGEDGVHDYQMKARRKSGEIRTVLVSTEGMELDGEYCILSSITDITERKQAEEAVEKERQRFYDVLETLPAYLVLLTPDHHVPVANRFFRERFGESGGRRCYEYLFARSQPCEICETYKVLDTKAPGRWEWTGPDGRNYDVFDYPFTDVDGSTLILEMGIDITEQKLAEARLRRVNRALSVLNQCNQVLVRAENEGELLQEMCEIIVKTGEYLMAWVGYAEQDEGRSVRSAAQFGFEEGYLESAQITWADNERGRGPTGTAIRQGQIQVNQNFLANPKMTPWHGLALSRGYQSSIALPLQDGKSTFGALTIYSAAPDAFDEEEVHLLNDLANDLAFGISALHVRAERKRAEDVNRQLSRIVEQTEDTVVVTNHEGLIEYVNPAFERLTGYSKEEALGKTPRVIKSGVHDHEFYRNLWNTILRGEAYQSEIANCRKNGELYYEVKTITPLRDAHGTITHFVATGKDISDHKHDEEQLHRAYDELEIRVQERTEQLRIAISELEDEIMRRKQVEMEIQRYAEELRSKNEELTLFNHAMVGRELRMIELKKEVNQLCGSAGQQPRYALDFEKE